MTPRLQTRVSIYTHVHETLGRHKPMGTLALKQGGDPGIKHEGWQKTLPHEDNRAPPEQQHNRITVQGLKEVCTSTNKQIGKLNRPRP